MKDKQQWPEDYLDWHGTIEELVAEAGKVLAQISPEVEAPTLSGVRYYQNKGNLGRGRKQGRVATFDFNDLATVVATKQMVKQQLPLSVTRGMLSPSNCVDNLMKGAGLDEYASYGSPAVATTMAMSCATQPHPEQPGNVAEQTVAKLLAASNLSASNAAYVHHRALAGGNMPMVNQTMSSTPCAPVMTTSALPPGGVLRYALAAGVSIEIPADPSDRAEQARALREFADQLHPLPHQTWRTTK